MTESTVFSIPPGRIALCGLALCAVCAGGVTGGETPVPVEIAAVESVEGLERGVSLTGTVTARRTARLSSRTTGLVEELQVDAGSRVKRGDLLMRLDTRLAEISLELIRAEIEQAGIALEEAKRREEEVRELSQAGGFPKSQAETLKSTVRIGEAGLKQLRVRDQEQRETIERHRLMAPFDGVIAGKLSEAGEWVVTGTPVLELVELEGVRFDLQVPQELFALVKVADGVKVTLDAFPGQPLAGRVAVMVPVKDAVSRTFLTRIELEDPRSLAAPGMSGTALIAARPDGGDSVRVPRDAVVRFPDGTAKV